MPTSWMTKLLFFREVGLAAVDVEAGAPGKPGPGGRADGALVEDLLDRAHGGGEAEVLVHGEPCIVLAGLLDDGDAIFPGRRERLLHNGRNAALGGNRGEFPVGVHAGGDVQKVDLHRIEHVPHVGEVRNPEGLAGSGSARRVPVAHGREHGALWLQVSPGIEVVLGIEAAPHHADRHALLRRRRAGCHGVPLHLA